MFSAFQTFGRLGAGARAVAAAWSPLALWPLGASSPGMWSDGPSYPASCFQDSAGATPISTVGTVLDSSNPVGLILDRKGGLALGPELASNTGGPFTTTTGFTTPAYNAGTGVGNASLSISNGCIRVTNSAAGTEFGVGATGFSTDIGVTYKLVVIAGANSGGTACVYIGNTPDNYDVAANITSFSSYYFVATATTTYILLSAVGPTANAWAEWSSISVKEIPGLHLSQATSPARPLASGMVNWFEKSRDFADVSPQGWTGYQRAVTTDGTLTPDGRLASKVTATGATYAYLQKVFTTVAGRPFTTYFDVNAGNTAKFSAYYINQGIAVHQIEYDLSAVTATTISGAATGTIELQAGGYYRCALNATPVAGNNNDIIWAGPGVQGSVVSGEYVYLDKAQLNLGSTALPYQRVNTDSDYTATGFPQYLKFDGVDDALSSATFSAGTLTSSMDCLIAVRRDSAANAVCGLYESVSDANKVFGIAESGSSSGCVGSGAGTPTVWVDNTQLTGGTAVTRGTLHTALSAGDIHILEFRGLDLSTWTAIGFGLYTSYKLLGARGDIMLYPSTASTEDKDAARQYLADKYGVTLA